MPAAVHGPMNPEACRAGEQCRYRLGRRAWPSSRVGRMWGRAQGGRGAPLTGLASPLGLQGDTER